MSSYRKAVGMGIALSVLALVACSGRTAKTDANSPRKPSESPPFPTHFEPPPPLEEPLPPDPDAPGLAYLQSVHQRLGEPWRTFLDDCRLRLPPNHVLNNLHLEVTVHLSIDQEGKLQGAALEKDSGVPEFDEVALEILREVAPFPAPPQDLMSDDDNVHIMWLLARDRRQAGVATAHIYQLKWPAERAVPKFLSRNDITTATRRLLMEIDEHGAPTADHVALGTRIAQAAVREALSSDKPAAQLLAAKTAAKIRLVSAAEGLRTIIHTSVVIAVRAQAITALGAIGDQGAAQLLVSVLDTAKGSGVGGKLDASIAAAAALAALGSAEVAESTVLEWLRTRGDKESLWAALVVMAEFPVPAAIPELAQMAGDPVRSRKVRMAACSALGAGTTKATANVSMKALRARFDDKDAAVRAACIGAVAKAARNRIKSRFTYWQVVEYVKKDRDERVRAAAVRAATALEPRLFHQELYLLSKEKSPVVLAALAQGLARVPDPAAYKKLVSLAKNENPVVRRQAVMSLLRHPDARGHEVAASKIGDSDPQVRSTAIRALSDKDALTALLDDESPEIRSIAFASLIRTAGRQATLERLLQGLLANPPKSIERARLAHAWLVSND